MAQTELTKENLSQVLTDIRKESGLTQVQLAEKIGVTMATINRAEGGHTSPSSNLLIDIANTLGKKVIIK